jgi:hypothetical protein
MKQKKKINGLDEIARVTALVFENPEIKQKDRRKVIAKRLEPMIEELFGSDYDPYILEKNTGK